MKYNCEYEVEVKKLKTKVDYLINKKAIVDVTENRGKRTSSQNAYVHLLFSIFGLEFGLTVDESKQEIKKRFLTYKKKGKQFVKKTSKLDTKEMTIFIEQFRNFSAKQGLYLPSANEPMEQAYRDIENNKQYLY